MSSFSCLYLYFREIGCPDFCQKQADMFHNFSSNAAFSIAGMTAGNFRFSYGSC